MGSPLSKAGSGRVTIGQSEQILCSSHPQGQFEVVDQPESCVIGDWHISMPVPMVDVARKYAETSTFFAHGGHVQDGNNTRSYCLFNPITRASASS